MMRFLGPWTATIRARLAIVIWVYWFIWWKLVLQVASRKCLKWKMKMPQQQTNSKMAMISVSEFNFGKPNGKYLIIWQFWELFGHIFLNQWNMDVLYKNLIKIFILCHKKPNVSQYLGKNILYFYWSNENKNKNKRTFYLWEEILYNDSKKYFCIFLRF